MDEWMKTIASLPVSGTLLLLLLLGLKRFYQNRFSRRCRYYILLLTALRFLLPVAPGAAGTKLPADRIECSELPLALYFTDYAETTTGILDEFGASDAEGNPIRCHWGFIADADGSGCMILTRFVEPIDPESICLLTFGGETVFMK